MDDVDEWEAEFFGRSGRSHSYGPDQKPCSGCDWCKPIEPESFFDVAPIWLLVAVGLAVLVGVILWVVLGPRTTP